MTDQPRPVDNTPPYSEQDHSEFDAWYDSQPERIGGLRTRSNHAWDAGYHARDAEIAALTARVGVLEGNLKHIQEQLLRMDYAPETRMGWLVDYVDSALALTDADAQGIVAVARQAMLFTKVWDGNDIDLAATVDALSPTAFDLLDGAP